MAGMGRAALKRRATLPHMSGNGEAASRGFGTARFALTVQGASLEMSARLPEGLVQPAVLLPVLRDLSESMAELAVRRAAQRGEKPSCREGCCACCYHPVPIAPTEARMLAEWLEAQPEEKRSALRARFRDVAARLEETGIAQTLRESSGRPERDAIGALAVKYFALAIPCPFLEEGRCAIYATRPLRCREYMVSSPAEFCSHPESKEIAGIEPAVRLSRILGRWDASGDEQSPELILLTMLDEWVAKHPAAEDRAHRTSPEMLQEFLRKFAKDAEEGSREAGTEGRRDCTREQGLGNRE
jgi:Fe-S-cluster containining protein